MLTRAILRSPLRFKIIATCILSLWTTAICLACWGFFFSSEPIRACETETITNTLVGFEPAWSISFTQRLARYPWVNDAWLAVETHGLWHSSSFDQFHFLNPQSGAIFWQYPDKPAG